MVQQSFEERDGGEKIVAECAEQVDVVEVSVAGEAVRQVVAGVTAESSSPQRGQRKKKRRGHSPVPTVARMQVN